MENLWFRRVIFFKIDRFIKSETKLIDKMTYKKFRVIKS